MIKFNELKIGNYLLAAYETKVWKGEVSDLNGDEQQVCVATDVQEFWYEPTDLFPIPVNDVELLKLNFSKQRLTDGLVKYSKGAFRIVVTGEDFSKLDMWYREDKRHHPDVHFIHQLQNHYLAMTKVQLTYDLV